MEAFYTPGELTIAKQVFADNLELLVLVRKALLQGELSQMETDMLKQVFEVPTVTALLKKCINPDINKMANPFHVVDIISEIDLAPVPVEHAYLQLRAYATVKVYLDQVFTELSGGAKATIKFDELGVVPEEVLDKQGQEVLYTRVHARNMLIQHLDKRLFNNLRVVAGKKDETPEEQLKRLNMENGE